jgi:hypothetical protein
MTLQPHPPPCYKERTFELKLIGKNVTLLPFEGAMHETEIYSAGVGPLALKKFSDIKNKKRV